jgi:hypothetical protein
LRPGCDRLLLFYQKGKVAFALVSNINATSRRFLSVNFLFFLSSYLYIHSNSLGYTDLKNITATGSRIAFHHRAASSHHKTAHCYLKYFAVTPSKYFYS